MADSDIEIIDLLRQGRRVIRMPRVLRIRFDPFHVYNDKQFLQRFRFSKEGVLALENMFKDELETINRGHNLTPLQQILVTLRFMATGSFQVVSADLMGVSITSVNRSIYRTIRAIAARHRENIRFPSGPDIRQTKDAFYRYCQFPGVVGAIDCTHIPITNPGGDNAELFRNRKGFHSINTQVVCNMNMEIINMVIRWPGSTHDSRIFDNCRLRTRLEDGHIDGLLLGDSGYACRYYLMTPFLNPQTQAERGYNYSHKRGRSCIEHLFGVWKRRFPCLRLGLRLKLNRSLIAISAAAVLYQLLKRMGEPEPEEDEDDEDNEPDADVAPEIRDIRGQIRRRAIVEEHFNH